MWIPRGYGRSRFDNSGVRLTPLVELTGALAETARMGAPAKAGPGWLTGPRRRGNGAGRGGSAGDAGALAALSVPRAAAGGPADDAAGEQAP